MLYLLLPILSYDIWFYISHVMLHSRVLHKYHHVHHMSQDPNWVDTYVSHWAEGPFQGVGVLFPYAVYTYSWSDMIIVLTFLNIRGMMRHDKRWAWLIGNHHLLHHAHGDYNYGEFWIDSLLGTKYNKAEEYKYGLIYV